MYHMDYMDHMDPINDMDQIDQTRDKLANARSRKLFSLKTLKIHHP